LRVSSSRHEQKQKVKQNAVDDLAARPLAYQITAAEQGNRENDVHRPVIIRLRPARLIAI
jgi:hypothetical protein